MRKAFVLIWNLPEPECCAFSVVIRKAKLELPSMTRKQTGRRFLFLLDVPATLHPA